MTTDPVRPVAPHIPLSGDEPTLLAAFLAYYRASLLDRAWGLDEAQLQQTLPPSTLSIGRLITHMMMVENTWYRVRFDGEDMIDLFTTLDWDADIDAEMTLSSTMSGQELRAAFTSTIDDSLARVAAASSLEQLSVAADVNGDHWDLRWIQIHMIEEYARHVGHADLIRESIDGDLAP